VNTTEELLGRKSSGSGVENREYGCRDPLSWPRGTLYPQMLAVTSPTSGGRSVGIVRSRTEATEFLVYFIHLYFQYKCRQILGMFRMWHNCQITRKERPVAYCCRLYRPQLCCSERLIILSALSAPRFSRLLYPIDCLPKHEIVAVKQILQNRLV
jgi:hypothetical protein